MPPPLPVKLKDVADALLYVGARDSLTSMHMTRGELDGTPYGKEIERRFAIAGFPADFASKAESTDSETPQFTRPQTSNSNAQVSAPPLPPPPKNMGAPLPPRPASQ
jgi:hypothetical protein